MYKRRIKFKFQRSAYCIAMGVTFDNTASYINTAVGGTGCRFLGYGRHISKKLDVVGFRTNISRGE